MRILVINSGSSSIKFQLFDLDKKNRLASGIIEEVGGDSSTISLLTKEKITKKTTIKNHEEGFLAMERALFESGALNSLQELDAIGHRVVHGGKSFSKPILIDESVIERLKEISPLAPLHNPSHIVGIEIAIRQSKGVKQVAVFDTAFHKTIPNYAHTYAIPYELYEKMDVKKYGFHGTSHHYVSKEASKFLNIEYKNFNAISLHLGNGASATAINNGKSVDTSMGLSPLEGLIMGTRSGDIDPAILFYLHKELNYGVKEFDELLNKQSGLRGICGKSDMREVRQMAQDGDEKAILAIEMFAYRIKKYIGAYSAVLNRVDALIFTGGIGENDSDLRYKICNKLQILGIEIDSIKNKSIQRGAICDISKDGQGVKILVVPTDEELEIALETKRVVKCN